MRRVSFKLCLSEINKCSLLARKRKRYKARLGSPRGKAQYITIAIASQQNLLETEM